MTEGQPGRAGFSGSAYSIPVGVGADGVLCSREKTGVRCPVIFERGCSDLAVKLGQ